MRTSTPQLRETKKARTATRGRRYRCTICRKRSPGHVTAPYYCPAHVDHKKDDSHEREVVREERDAKKRVKVRT